MITTDDIKSFNLDEYTGSVLSLTLLDGSTEVTDTTTLIGEMARAYAEARRITEARILLAVPEYKQRNLAMGIYDEQEATECLDTIKALRNGLKVFLERLALCENILQIGQLKEEYELADNTL